MPTPDPSAISAALTPGTIPIGEPGLSHSLGQVSEELHPRLKGPQAMRVFEEMASNDATIAAALYSIEGFLRRIRWRVKPASDSDAAKTEAKFVEQCMNDMDRSWSDFICDALSMLVYGFSLHEIVLKYRRGVKERNPRFRSKYDDGRMGWRNVDLRAQRSISRWDIDLSTGEIKGAWQASGGGSTEVYLPMSRLVLFRTKSYKNNPEGRSVLRGAYRSWHFKKRLEETEAVGLVRSLVNIPVMELPSRMMSPNASTEEKRVRAMFERLVSLISQDRLTGVTVPAERDDQDNPTGYKLRLMGAAGNQLVADPVIKRYDARMLMSLAAEFLILGMSSTGSFALAAEKSSNFVRALEWYADVLADAINDTCIRRLMEVNNVPVELWPTLIYDPIADVDVSALGLFLSQAVGFLTPTVETENRLRERTNLPLIDEGDFAPGPVTSPVEDPVEGPAEEP